MSLKTIKQALSKRLKIFKWFGYYTKQLSFSSHKGKPQIVVCFDGLFPHGGLVDRLKGIVSFYQIAQELEYDFKIVFDNPFTLDTFLETNTVDWKLSRKAIKYHPTQSKLLYLVNNFDINPIEVIKKSKAKRFYVYANIDYGKKIFPEFNTDELEQKWRNSFNELFTKSKVLTTKLNAIDDTSFIAFHSRFTSLMGDFVDSSMRTISEGEKQHLSNTLLEIINRVKEERQLPAYVFSDSINFITDIKSKSAVKVIEGNPFHMENYSGNSTLEGHLKTLIDFFMLSKSDTVYFLNVGKMYHSSFSKYASIIGDTKFETLEQ